MVEVHGVLHKGKQSKLGKFTAEFTIPTPLRNRHERLSIRRDAEASPGIEIDVCRALLATNEHAQHEGSRRMITQNTRASTAS